MTLAGERREFESDAGPGDLSAPDRRGIIVIHKIVSHG